MKVFVKSEKRLLGDFAQKIWLPYLKNIKSSSRLEEVAIRLYIAPFFDDTPLMRITSDKVNQWLDWLRRRNFSPASRNRYLQILRNIFNYANELGVIRKLPFEGVKAEKIERRKPSVIAPELFSKLILYLQEQDSPGHRALLLIMRTGLKKGEILKLRKDQVKENLLELHGNSDKNHNFYLSLEAANILEIQMAESICEWVFPNQAKTGPIRDVFSLWKAIRNEFGMANVRICDLHGLYKEWKLAANDHAILDKYSTDSIFPGEIVSQAKHLNPSVISRQD